MSFCTIVEFEWSEPDTQGRFEAAVAAATERSVAPEGRLTRIVGVDERGAHVVEVWATPADAQRFAEATAPALADVGMPPPSRVESFEVSVYDVA